MQRIVCDLSRKLDGAYPVAFCDLSRTLAVIYLENCVGFIQGVVCDSPDHCLRLAGELCVIFPGFEWDLSRELCGFIQRVVGVMYPGVCVGVIQRIAGGIS